MWVLGNTKADLSRIAVVMSKPTTCKDAIALWEKQHGAAAAEAREVELQFQWPPVEKMDAALSTLTACEYWMLLALLNS
ncbi:unnamed protein product [Plutella xylostella]|uniref:(diamondback moth) hypothetical protein n=1 Tax=Plutella xylostella TaxID=51655 RepID=A0A8S4E5J1_PLUXY|nr:unnamed protein product [Plutella xylostella]